MAATTTPPEKETAMFPVGGDPSEDPEVSPGAGRAISAVVLLCGLVLVGLTISLWGSDMSVLLRGCLVVMSVAAVGIGVAGLLRRGG